MSAGGCLLVEEHAILVAAGVDEVEAGLAHLLRIRVLDHHDAVLREERFGDFQTFGLVAVGMWPVKEIETDRPLVDVPEILVRITLVKLVILAAKTVEPLEERRAGSSLARIIVDADAAFVGGARHT